MKLSSCYIVAVLFSCIFTKKVQSEIDSQDLVKKLTEALEALKNIGQKSTNDINSDNEPKNDIFHQFGENNGKFFSTYVLTVITTYIS